MTTAQKLLAKFNTIRLRRSVLWSGSDVNSSLQVEHGNLFDSLAFDPDLHGHDHVTLFDSLISFRFELSSIRRILPNLMTITSNKYSITSDFLGNFLAQTRSRQPSTETSLLRRDGICAGAAG